MVETGHLPSWPLIEIRRPCNSSSQTFSTVPAFPSVRTTALPINSDCAALYSFKIFEAWRFTDGSVSTAMFVPVLSTGNDWRLLLQFAEPVDLRSEAPR